MKQISVQMLQANNACQSQVNKFQELFPQGVIFESEQDVIQKCLAVAGIFDWAWAAENLLKQFAYKRYLAVKQSAYDQYQLVRDLAYDQYQLVRDLACEQYLTVQQPPAWEQYLAVKESAWAQYRAVQAEIFAKLFWNQG